MIFSFITAIIIDFFYGEVPTKIHPVIWIGKITNKYKQIFKPKNKISDYIFSCFLLIILSLLIITPLFTIENYLLNGLILSTTFSFGYFLKEIKKLYADFINHKLTSARNKLSFLVSRNTKNLSNNELLAASIETTIENITDSITSPLFYFLIGGVPLAMFYRIVNTLDSMIGYKNQNLFYYGKIPAKLDDILNYIPARITVVLFYFVSKIFGDNTKHGFKIYHRDKNNTESPNAGCTMSYIAGVLKIKLIKSSCYCLGDAIENITTNKFKKAINYLIATTISIYLIILTILILKLLIYNN